MKDPTNAIINALINTGILKRQLEKQKKVS
jgi:hypothetical protein